MSIGKLLGRLAFRGWRAGTRADRRWAKGREERRWRHEAEEDLPLPPLSSGHHAYPCDDEHCRRCPVIRRQ